MLWHIVGTQNKMSSIWIYSEEILAGLLLGGNPSFSYNNSYSVDDLQLFFFSITHPVKSNSTIKESS